MKRIIRIFVIETVVLVIVSRITTGLTFQNGTIGILISGVGLTIASLLIKPVINLLLLPLNLLTFGFFRWLGSAITLFLADLIMNEFSIGEFVFKGFNSELVVIPSLHIPSGPLSYLAFSFLISLVTSIIYWLVI